MKLYICSDIHGVAPATKQLLDKIGQELNAGTAKLVLLGDVYNPGPRNGIPDGYAPMEVAELLNGYKDNVIAIKGNCDSEIDEEISQFKFYASATAEIADHTVMFTHGHKCNADAPAKELKGGDIVFFGHFHKPAHRMVEGVHYVCVGGLGVCAPQTERCYAVLEDKSVEVRPLDGGAPRYSFNLE